MDADRAEDPGDGPSRVEVCFSFDRMPGPRGGRLLARLTRVVVGRGSVGGGERRAERASVGRAASRPVQTVRLAFMRVSPRMPASLFLRTVPYMHPKVPVPDRYFGKNQEKEGVTRIVSMG